MGAGAVRGFSRLGARVVSLDINAEAGDVLAKEAGADSPRTTRRLRERFPSAAG
jgi:hypothetical protein